MSDGDCRYCNGDESKCIRGGCVHCCECGRPLRVPAVVNPNLDPYGHALRAIQSLRGWGAVSVRVGDISATFAPPLGLLPEEPPTAPMTDEERQAEAERHLFGSAD
jgi:hypothetical protein